MDRVIHAGSVVYTGIGRPTEQAGVLVDEGRVVRVAPLARLQLDAPEASIVERRTVLAPPPVNAHTHLDMSDYPYHELPYGEWIPWVVAQAVAGLRSAQAARRGLQTLIDDGISAFGDIVTLEEVMVELLTSSPLPGVAYWEVLEPNPEHADAMLAETENRVRRWKALERPGGVRVGLSPHTGHTVSSRLLRGLMDLAARENLPVQIHIAEAPEETELYRFGTGSVAAGMTRAFGVGIAEILGREPSPDLSPVRRLAALGILDARPTLVHVVNVDATDVTLIARAGCPVVHCPRSNAALSCGVFPWAEFARAGVEVGLGTDSVASGRTLRIREEVQAALETHGRAAGLGSVVRAAVKGGARALATRPPIVMGGDSLADLQGWP